MMMISDICLHLSAELDLQSTKWNKVCRCLTLTSIFVSTCFY